VSSKQERASAQRKGGGALGRLAGALMALVVLAAAGVGGPEAV
jgi:hypothetical protein